MIDDKHIPILDASMEDFKEHLEFNLWSTHSSSDTRNDRDRPYDGQPWTDNGERGRTEVKGLTMRDIIDCFVKALLESSPSEEYLNPLEWLKCWDFSSGEQKPTQYLLDNQDKHPSVKVELGTWRTQDVYKVDLNKVDPMAIAQNMTCEIEKMMGIFPNIP